MESDEVSAAGDECPKPVKEGSEESAKVNIYASEEVAIDEVPGETWHDGKEKMEMLLDPGVVSNIRTQTVNELIQLFEQMERKVLLEIKFPEKARLLLKVHLANEETDSNRTKRTKTYGMDEFRNHLISLGNQISALKAATLSAEYRPSSVNENNDLQAFRNVHRNFRRILQKESVFLRDELLRARETILNLERKCTINDVTRWERSPYQRSNSLLNNATRIIPFNNFAYHPVNFINVETVSPRKSWVSSRRNNAIQYSQANTLFEKIDYQKELLDYRSPSNHLHSSSSRVPSSANWTSEKC